MARGVQHTQRGETGTATLPGGRIERLWRSWTGSTPAATAPWSCSSPEWQAAPLRAPLQRGAARGTPAVYSHAPGPRASPATQHSHKLIRHLSRLTSPFEKKRRLPRYVNMSEKAIESFTHNNSHGKTFQTCQGVLRESGRTPLVKILGAPTKSDFLGCKARWRMIFVFF